MAALSFLRSTAWRFARETAEMPETPEDLPKQQHAEVL